MTIFYGSLIHPSTKVTPTANSLPLFAHLHVGSRELHAAVLAGDRSTGTCFLMSLHLLLGYALPTVRAGHRSRDALGEVVRVVLLVVPSPQAPGVGARHQHRSQLPQSSLIWEEL